MTDDRQHAVPVEDRKPYKRSNPKYWSESINPSNLAYTSCRSAAIYRISIRQAQGGLDGRITYFRRRVSSQIVSC